MKKLIPSAAALAVVIALCAPPVAAARKKRATPVVATAPPPAPAVAVAVANPAAMPKKAAAPAPGEIVAAAPAGDWTAIAASDVLVMELGPDGTSKNGGKARRVVIQLMPAPFSQGWVGNIRKLAAAKFWDGTAIVRVQDNYVTQWGDPDGEDAAKAKKLPAGLSKMSEGEYTHYLNDPYDEWGAALKAAADVIEMRRGAWKDADRRKVPSFPASDPYSRINMHHAGWSFAANTGSELWPVHCYGMVGVGRNLSPDTGTGAELYTVIGHAPRHLDRNIALVGRVIEGMEHMSSLPRGTGALGFYESEAERTPIVSVRIGAEATDLPAFEYLNTESESFAKYADARANRRDPFFIRPAGGADICNIPVPVRRRRG